MLNKYSCICTDVVLSYTERHMVEKLFTSMNKNIYLYFLISDISN